MTRLPGKSSLWPCVPCITKLTFPHTNSQLSMPLAAAFLLASSIAGRQRSAPNTFGIHVTDNGGSDEKYSQAMNRAYARIVQLKPPAQATTISRRHGVRAQSVQEWPGSSLREAGWEKDPLKWSGQSSSVLVVVKSLSSRTNLQPWLQGKGTASHDTRSYPSQLTIPLIFTKPRAEKVLRALS